MAERTEIAAFRKSVVALLLLFAATNEPDTDQLQQHGAKNRGLSLGIKRRHPKRQEN